LPTVTITWHTQNDGHVCPICKAIDGYTWTFENAVPDSLIHPQYGEVWNTMLGSLAHDHAGYGSRYRSLFSNCRCRIEPRFQLADLAEKIRVLRDELRVATDPNASEKELET
jgi:hypothetical protein